jgi:hypothetical protein
VLACATRSISRVFLSRAPMSANLSASFSSSQLALFSSSCLSFRPPMFLEFHLVFLHNFSIFFLFFSKFLNFNSKNRRFLKSDPADPAEFWRFSEKSASFLNPTHHDPIFSSFLVFMHGKLIRSPCLFSSVSLRSRYYPGRFPVPRMSKCCSLILVSRPSLSP